MSETTKHTKCVIVYSGVDAVWKGEICEYSDGREFGLKDMEKDFVAGEPGCVFIIAMPYSTRYIAVAETLTETEIIGKDTDSV